jgi:hypothetical protein
LHGALDVVRVPQFVDRNQEHGQGIIGRLRLEGEHCLLEAILAQVSLLLRVAQVDLGSVDFVDRAPTGRQRLDWVSGVASCMSCG